MTHVNLTSRVQEKVSNLLTSGPHALAVSKELLSTISRMSPFFNAIGTLVFLAITGITGTSRRGL